MPSPSPIAGGAVGESAPEVADAREMTDVEKEAADAIKERDAAVAKADQEREEADKARAEAEEAKLKEDEERIKKAEADREAIEAALHKADPASACVLWSVPAPTTASCAKSAAVSIPSPQIRGGA